MDIKKTLKWTIPLLAIFAFQDASANQDGLPGDVYRAKYAFTRDMPDHLAYLSLMQNLSEAENAVGEEANIAHIQAHLSMEHDRAAQFLHFVLDSYSDMVETNRAVTNRMLCQGKMPRYEVNEAYAVLDVLDDIKETNLRKHYKRAMINFGSRNGEEITAWLDAIKTGASHHKYDHRAVYEHADASVEKVISTACNLLAMQSP